MQIFQHVNTLPLILVVTSKTDVAFLCSFSDRGLSNMNFVSEGNISQKKNGSSMNFIISELSV